MISIKEDGYITDYDGVVYPLQNVLSIKWELVEEIHKKGEYEPMFKVWFSKNEIDKMEDWI
jgi:hypothetical protein